MYDSQQDTEKHIRDVAHFMKFAFFEIEERIRNHDASKLIEPEKSIFDEFTPKLKGTTYGSDEYKEFLSQMGVALKHHYENNRHHPEHFENGVNDMSLLDLLEMVADWTAATLRHEDGDIEKSLEINKARFGMSDQLTVILRNTVRDVFKWIKG